MFTNDLQNQRRDEENISDQILSPSEKLGKDPLAPGPGIEDLIASDLEREFNPNTE
jgi:hypothetical protein